MNPVLERAIKDITQVTLTADEFFDSPFAEGFELQYGKLIPKGGLLQKDMPTGAVHGAVTDELSSRLSVFVRENRLGKTFAAETGFVLGAGTVRGADISFVGNEKLAEHKITEKFYPVAPDLAVEVISPGNSSDEIQEKILEYLSGGTELIWIIYPKMKMVHIYRSDKSGDILRENDMLDGENVVPGFRVNLSEIFNF